MISLPPLPYAYEALEPEMSAQTLRFHHDKHHAGYVEKTNALADEAGLSGRSLEEIIAAAGRSDDSKLYNNAAQAWNHAFFWQSMTPDASEAEGGLAEAIAASFGDRAALRDKFIERGDGHFASGWLWLAARGGKLELVDTHDAGTLALGDRTPLLVCDLWEHAYYLDRQNDRKAYLEAWFDKLANWDFAARQFEAVGSGSRSYNFQAETIV